MKREKRFFDNFWSFNFEDMLHSFSEEMNELMRPSNLEDQENGPISYGYSIRIGPDTNYQPEVKQWGNLNDYRRKNGLPNIEFPLTKIQNPQAQEVFPEPDSTNRFIDFIDEPKTLRIIVEVPGFTKANLSIDINEKGTEINLSGKSERKELNKTIKLPTKIEPKSTKSSINNGVLEIIGNKTDKSTKKVRIDID
jgi:HSP20 family molecular chaperone IbpA